MLAPGLAAPRPLRGLLMVAIGLAVAVAIAHLTACQHTTASVQYAGGGGWNFENRSILLDASGAQVEVIDPSRGYQMRASVNGELRPEGQSAASETARLGIRTAGWLAAAYLALTGNVPAAAAAAGAGEGANWLLTPNETSPEASASP